MNFKKKAIEPIVATILLVVVAVILVTIVLAWGRNVVNQGTSTAGDITDDACSAATIAISNCDFNGTGDATFMIKNTSNTHTFPASDFNCGVIDDSNSLNNDLTNDSIGEELIPGAQKVLTCASGVSAEKVTLKVWSVTCPNMAVGELKNCS